MDENINVSKKEIKKTVETLLKVYKDGEKKLPILKESDNINLQFTFKKIPKINNKTIKLPLPHSVRSSNTDVCLFVKDLDRKKREHELTTEHYKDLLRSKGVLSISEIIPLKQLKLEYKPHEAKKNLSNMFDLFLADETIIRLLPPLLGKNFYGRKRIPVSVNLKAQDLKSEINKAINNTRCIISGRGSSSMATVAHTQMSVNDIVDNVMSAVEQISKKIPGGAINVRNFYIKTTDSLALPIYISLDSSDDVELPLPVFKVEEEVMDDITTVVHGKVKVGSTGEVRIINRATIQNPQKRKGQKMTAIKPKKSKRERLSENIENGGLKKQKQEKHKKKVDTVKRSTLKQPKKTKQKI